MVLNRRILLALALGILVVVAAVMSARGCSSGIPDPSTAPPRVQSTESPGDAAEKRKRIGDVRVQDDDDDEIAGDQELARRGALPDREPTFSVDGLPGTTTGLGPYVGITGRAPSAEASRDRTESLQTDQEEDARHVFIPDEQPRRGVSDGRIYGLRSRGPAAGGSEGGSFDEGEEDDFDSLLPWVSGQSRGYTMLYAMQPQARGVVERHVEALIRARIRQPYIAVLIDGTFGKDYEYLKGIIRRLSTDGRTLTLVLYLTNGPTMRRWKETPVEAPFVRIEPVDFRNLIRRDRAIRAQFVAIANEAKAIFQYSTQINSANRNVAVVMLEDNLNRQAYGEMRALAQPSLKGFASFVRNPCLGCYRGNDMDSLGDSREEHALDRFTTLAQGDAYSLDGVGFAYPGEAAGQQLPAEQLFELMRMAYEKGLRWVGLWRHSWQGLEIGKGNPHPEIRPYVPSTDPEVEFEISVIRTGLPIEEVPE